uniref:Pvc16 family protein n=1 Tax=Sandarakinorhabdus oryzae TaxID=2675220 RepID=UPI001A9CA5D6
AGPAGGAPVALGGGGGLMARHQAIAAAGAAIVAALRSRFPSTQFGDADLNIELRAMADIQTAMGTPPAIALLLWRITPSSTRAPSPRVAIDGHRFKASLAVDLHYLMIPYGNSAEAQQRLLGWMLRAMEDLGPLLASQLNNALSESDVFQPQESVELVLDQLSLADHLTLWDRIRLLPPSANYVLRRVLIDSDEEITTHPAVTQRQFRMGVPS